MKSNPEMFKSKAGTRSLGIQYEDKVTAYFSLLLAQDSAVSDFNISSNDEKYGNFDDLVMQVDYCGNDAKETIAVQLKHQHEMRKIPVNSFLGDKGDFSLLKYFEETEKMNIPEEVSLVLFTNRKFGLHKERSVLELEIKTTDEPENKTKPIQLEIFQPEEEDQPSLVKFINSNTRSQVLQFKVRNSSDDGHEKFKYFLKRFYFYSSEDDVKGIETKLKKQFLRQTTCEQFVKFVENWSKEEGKKFKLNKETVISKFMECLLSPYLSMFCEEILGQDYLYDKLFSKFDVTIFEEPVPLVQGYDRNFIESKKTSITWKEEKIFGLSKKADATKLLWHLNEIPLIIKSDCPNDVLSKVLNLGKNESFGRRFIVIGKIDEEFKEKKVLRDLSDLLDEKLEEHLENCKVNFQGRELPLLDYVKDDKEIAKLFSTKDIARLLSGRKTIFLGENIDITFPYINRLLQNPIIDLDVLKKVSEDDVVVISCRGRKAFLEKRGYTNTERIILFEDFCSSQNFLELCFKHTRKNVHHLQVTKENYLSWMATENASQKDPAPFVWESIFRLNWIIFTYVVVEDLLNKVCFCTKVG